MKCTKHSGLLLCLGYILNSSDSQVVRAESALFTTQKHNADRTTISLRQHPERPLLELYTLWFDLESSQNITVKLVCTAFLLDAQHLRDSVKNKPASLFVSLGKSNQRDSPCWCGRQIASNS